ncbi:hypothetical protein KDW_01170 [Dictyobacter vulcani]|uniref:Uncharacterized protein n=1 Tax=Dictyobacter vulcani TaxID=2607529 RepID=A0A5J4KF90_9CHLR|nr:hypothetical protein [Dictyobacter vulcani]GER85955.1 hypothetical protein KDW_01170 [Dictyobacter vulcani]
MAFTQDELQSLNTIMEQKLLAQRHDLERTFDLRLQALRREFEQRVTTVHHDLARTISQRLTDQHTRTREFLQQQFNSQQTHYVQALEHAFEIQQQQQQQRYEDTIDRALAAQLLAIEQMMHQRFAATAQDSELTMSYTLEGQPEFDTIEVQTEIPWEELATLVDNTIEERLTALQKTVLAALKELGQTTQTQITALQLSLPQPGNFATTESLSSSHESIAVTQNAAKSVERLEQLIEAMQVAMTSNSALISNRLYHHQQLPLERAHPSQQSQEGRATLSELNTYRAYPAVPDPLDKER